MQTHKREAILWTENAFYSPLTSLPHKYRSRGGRSQRAAVPLSLPLASLLRDRDEWEGKGVLFRRYKICLLTDGFAEM